MIGPAEPLGALRTDMQVKAVKYSCGCTKEREQPVAIVVFWQRCQEHGQPITGYWRK